MPRGDRTGPNGLGSRSGRGAGYCSGNNEPGCTTAGGRGDMGGLGGRRGGGRGLGRRLNQGMGQGFALSRKAQELEEQMAEIKNQLKQRP